MKRCGLYLRVWTIGALNEFEREQAGERTRTGILASTTA